MAMDVKMRNGGTRHIELKAKNC